MTDRPRKPINADRLRSIVGNNIRERRRELGYSLRDAARGCAINQSQFFRVENGHDCSLATLFVVCWGLGVEVCDVLPTIKTVEAARS